MNKYYLAPVIIAILLIAGCGINETSNYSSTDRDIDIVPIFVPAMNPERMDECGKALAEAIKMDAENHGWE